MVPARRSDYTVAGLQDEQAAKSSSVSPARIAGLLKKWWWIPVVTLLLSLGGAVMYVRKLPPTYVSYARMWEPEKMRLPEGELFSEDMQTFLGTQTELLQGAELREMTLARLRAAYTNSTGAAKYDQDPPVAVHISQLAKSSVFVLNAISSDPLYTRDYLDALMTVYLEYKKNLRKALSGDTLASITEEVHKWERDLKSEQAILTAFERTNNLAILQEEGTVAGGYLARLQTQLSDLQFEDRILSITNLADSGGPTQGKPVADTGVKDQNADNELVLLKRERAKLSRYLRSKHPKMVKLDAQIDRGEALMEMSRAQSREKLEESRQAVKVRIANMESSIQDWEKRVVEADSRIAEAEQLKLNVQRVQGVYDHLVSLVQNVGISREISQDSLSILATATPAFRTFSQERSILTGSVMGGLGLGLAIVCLIGLCDDRFTSEVEVNEKCRISVVGHVPEMIVPKGKSALPLLESNDSRHIYAEAYRILRSALMFLSPGGERPKLVLITSAVPNEGKSSVTANLSRMLALGGATVMVLDADMRRGCLDQLMGLRKSPGLADLLLNRSDLEQVIQTGSPPNLSFIGRGASEGNPGDLFLNPLFDQLLITLRQRYDYVLIDSCPVFVANDATTLAPKMDGTLFVVRNRFSSARAVEEAVNLLQRRHAKVLGVVFNRAKVTGRSYYYYKSGEYYPPAAVT